VTFEPATEMRRVFEVQIEGHGFYVIPSQEKLGRLKHPLVIQPNSRRFAKTLREESFQLAEVDRAEARQSVRSIPGGPCERRPIAESIQMTDHANTAPSDVLPKPWGQSAKASEERKRS